MQGQQKKHLFDDPRNVRRAIYVLYAVCAVAAAFEFLVDRHVDHPWEWLFEFYPLYGFVACVTLVLVAKQLRKFLRRGEDYYDG